MNKNIISIAVITLATIIIVLNFHIAFVKASNEKARIEAANSSINQAFTNVLAAEKAGGNVTQLLTRLNNAGQLLAEADNDYRRGNLVNNTSKTENARAIAEQVNSDALNLLNASINNSRNSFLLTLIFSITGVVIFVAVLLRVWRWLRRDHINRMLGLKPEVVENTA